MSDKLYWQYLSWWQAVVCNIILQSPCSFYENESIWQNWHSMRRQHICFVFLLSYVELLTILLSTRVIKQCMLKIFSLPISNLWTKRQELWHKTPPFIVQLCLFIRSSCYGGLWVLHMKWSHRIHLYNSNSQTQESENKQFFVKK